MKSINLFLSVKNKMSFVNTVFFIIFESTILYFSFHSFIILNENQLLYISSTLSQVVATLFGLSVTGYIFLDEKLKNDIEADQSLIDIVRDLKNKYKSKIILTGVLTFSGIFLCIINICLGVNSFLASIFLNNLILNNSIFISLLSIAKIILFIIQIIDPEKIQKESNIGKKHLVEKLEAKPDSSFEQNNNTKVSLEDFLTTYNDIESKISKIVSPAKINDVNGKYNNIYQNLKILHTTEKINMELLEKIDALRKYRNYLVHGQDMTINAKFYYLAKDIKKELETLPNNKKTNESN